MSKGIVYILTNPCLVGWVKIGMTERDDINKRLNELNSPPNIPLSYRCYAIYEVEDPKEVEQRIHSIIDKVDDSLHARERLSNGKIREREFFRISPETAYAIFKDIAALRHDKQNLKLYVPTQAEADEEEIAETKNKRSNNSFKKLNIQVGENISFLYDDEILATVANDRNKVKYLDEDFSVSGLAIKLLKEKFGWSDNIHVNGWRYFTKAGKTLDDLRDQIEGENSDI